MRRTDEAEASRPTKPRGPPRPKILVTLRKRGKHDRSLVDTTSEVVGSK